MDIPKRYSRSRDGDGRQVGCLPAAGLRGGVLCEKGSK
jgi:hypothetical protein